MAESQCEKEQKALSSALSQRIEPLSDDEKRDSIKEALSPSVILVRPDLLEVALELTGTVIDNG